MSVPGWVTRWLLRGRATISTRHDRELREELQLHLRLLEEEYTAQGLSPEAARRRAHHEFGNATLFQEASHDLFSFRFLEDLVRDLRYALREMRRSAAFTVLAVSSLAVGIGAVTTTFSVVDAFMLRGLPVHNPERLVAFSTADSPSWGSWPYPSFLRWRDSPDRRFEVAAASDVSLHDVPLRGSETPAQVRVSLVSANYFRVMGVDVTPGTAMAGMDRSAPGAAAVAVISEAFWERWFGRTPDILTKTLDLRGVRYSVVGVARQGFTGHLVGHPADLWIPLAMQPALMPGAQGLLDDRWDADAQWLRIFGRLNAGVSIDEATVSVNLIRRRFLTDKAAALGKSNPSVMRDQTRRVSLRPATTGFAPERARYARPLLILSGITMLVLLVACSNFTNLMLARSEARRQEFVIRLALGGGRWRLIRQLATECVLLAVLAGLFGLLLAGWATTASPKQFLLTTTPVELAFQLNLRVMAFVAACVTVVIAFGLWPCTRPARAAVVSSAHHVAAASSPARARAVAGRVVLVAQLAMCTVLLIGAGLLLRTVTNLRSQELGFDRNVLLVPVSPGQAGYTNRSAAMVVERMRERLAAVPGIEAVGISGPALLDYTNYWIDGSQQLTTDRGVVLPGARWTFAAVGPGFFEAVGMRFAQGTAFDAQAPADIVVINESLATFLFGQQSAVGRSIRLGPRGPMQLVTGVVNDAKQTSPRDRSMGVVYLPLRGFEAVVLAVRTTGPPSQVSAIVRQQLRAVAADVPIEKARTISEVLENAIAQERLMSVISLVLAGLAIAIGCLGLYALMSYDVAQRRRELGIRLALGATSTRVLTMVLRESAVLVLVGLAIGVPLAMAASRPLSSQLYGIEAHDPWTVLAVALLLIVVALLATLRPARTASRIDPIGLLRSE